MVVQDAGMWISQFALAVLVIGFPLLNAVLLIVFFLVPMREGAQKRMARFLEVVLSWGMLEVFFGSGIFFCLFLSFLCIEKEAFWRRF